MDEREFIQQLQARAREQKHVMQQVAFPRFFAFITEWLSNHPWRYLIPLALLLSLLLRAIIGFHYTNFVLWFFRSI